MLYGGLDLGGRRSRLHVVDASGAKVEACWIVGRRELLRAVGRWGRELDVALEATGSAFWTHDVLREKVGRVRVAHPRDLRAIAHARIKNDRLDAMKLAELNRGGLIPEVWVPPRQTRDQRELLLEHARVKRALGTEKTKVKALLRRWGVEIEPGALRTPESLRALRRLELPEGAKHVLEGKIAHAEWLALRRKGLSEEIERQIPLGERERRLMTIPGIGEDSARLLSNILGEVSRFGDCRQVASYVGLVPGERSTGGRVKRGPVTKEGNPWLRWALIQCAWAAVRNEKKDPTKPWCRMYEALVEKGKSKGRAIVAVANRLARVTYAVLRDERDYEVRARKEGQG